MRVRFYGYSILVLGLTAFLASCKAPTSSPSSPSKAWVVSTLAGSGTRGDENGSGAEAKFNNPYSVAVDSAGNVYVADSGNNLIRKITINSSGVEEVSTLAGSGEEGYKDGTVTEAQFQLPHGVAVDSGGNVYVADTFSYRIRKITINPRGVGEVTTLAGSTKGFEDGSGAAAKFSDPHGVAVDSNGNVYVADTNNHRIRKITAGGVVTTLAGRGTKGGYKDGPGAKAQFNRPHGVAVDSDGNVYVADEFNYRIRKITINSSGAGEVTTLAGSKKGFKDGPGTKAQFQLPHGVAVDSNGNVYVADHSSHCIRKITAGGVVTTLAGRGGKNGYKDGIGTEARFSFPQGVAVDSAGNNVYVADGLNRIRKIEYKVP